MGVYGAGLYGAGAYGIIIRMSYNQKRDEVFISKSADETLIFSPKGMSSISAEISDQITHSGKAIVHSPAVIAQDDITFSTDIINFGTNGLKALEFIYLDVDCPEDIFVTVRYRDDTQGAFLSAPQKQFNPEGACRIGVRGVDFILDFSIPSYSTLQLSSFDLNVQFVDRRFRRGVNIGG